MYSDTINTVCLLVVGCLRTMVAGRNDDAIAEELRMLAGSLGQIPQVNAGNRNGDDVWVSCFGEVSEEKSSNL